MIVPDIDKQKIAIVVVGYNKPLGLKRLLNSINNANYDDIEGVPLYISIDASGNEEVYNIARNFQWKYGVKYVNIENERLGLKKHIFQCASLTSFFNGVIILEDDLFVSSSYYHYSVAALKHYGNNDKIAGIALYNEETNGYVDIPFQPEINEYDVYAWQTVCSWGEVWNERMWKDFTRWLESWDNDFQPIDMMDRIKKWERAWSKYYYAYMLQNDKYFIYPYQALSTNFNDAGGEHGGGNTSIVQVSLQQNNRDYKFGEFDRLVKYDVYCQNKAIPLWLGIKPEELTVDFFGLKDNYKGRYVLAPFQLPYKRIKGFALCMRPWEMNVKNNIEGDDFYLYDRGNSEIVIPPKRDFQLAVADYYLRGFNLGLLQKYMWNSVKQRIKRRLHING